MKKLLSTFTTLIWLLCADSVLATFPVVASTNIGQSVSDATSHPVNMPSGLTSGDLILCHLSINGTATVSGMPAGWNLLNSNSSGGLVQGEVWYKISAGGESNFNYTTSVLQETSNRCWRITGWHGTTIPEIATAASSNANPNPPSLNPTNWDVEDTLWFALFSRVRGDTLVSSYPSSYGDNQNNDNTGTSSAAVQAGSSTRENATATEDPGSYATGAASNSWASWTVAIRPSAVTAAGGHPRRRNQ